jgi:hypothetical protein
MRLITSSTASIVVALCTTTLLVLNAAVSTLAQDTELCRCTAKFEHFYDRRSLIQQPQEEGDRSLTFSNYAYDYKDYYIDDEGYYVVEGVRVLPDDDPACDGSADDEKTTPYKRDGILARVFGQGRSLFEHDEDEEDMEEELPQQLRTLMGMMGMMGGSGKASSSSSDPSDDYYNYGDGGYGKGKVRFLVVWEYPVYFAATLFLGLVVLNYH